LLEHNIKVVRIGKIDLISADVHHVMLDQYKVLSKNENHLSVTKTVLKSTQVIATTCTGAGDLALKEMCFPYVIIDEATQVTEPNSLIPLRVVSTVNTHWRPCTFVIDPFSFYTR